MKTRRSRWRPLLASRFLWLVSFYYFVVFAARTCCENWAQLLVVNEKRLDSSVGSYFLTAFELGGLASSLLTGYITDWAVSMKKPNQRSNPRMIISSSYMLLSIFCLNFTITSRSAVNLPVFAFLLGACLYGNIAIFGIVATEAAPDALSGSSHAIVALAASVGGVVAGLPASWFANVYGWSAVFFALEVLCMVCAAVMMVTRSMDMRIAVDEAAKKSD